MKNKDYAEADVKDNDTLLKSRKGFFKKSNLIRLLIDIILITGIYITFTYLFEVGYVSSGSMEPYLYEGNFYHGGNVFFRIVSDRFTKFCHQ